MPIISTLSLRGFGALPSATTVAPTYELIEAKTLSSNQSSLQFTSIPNTFTDLLFLVSTRSTRTTWGDMVMRFNGGDSSTHRGRRAWGVGTASSDGSDSSEWTNITGNNQTANIFSNIQYYVPNYLSSTEKVWYLENSSESNASEGFNTFATGKWSGTTAITTVTFAEVSGHALLAGSTFYMYGIKNS